MFRADARLELRRVTLSAIAAVHAGAHAAQEGRDGRGVNDAEGRAAEEDGHRLEDGGRLGFDAAEEFVLREDLSVIYEFITNS